MKKLFLLLFLNNSILFFAQAPSKINYQGIARDANNTIITSPIDLKFVIIDNTSAIVHSEVQTNIQPNQSGIFSTQIGLITAISQTVTWKSGPYMLDVSLKTGSTFTSIGSQQLTSVPFALYAENAGNALPNGTLNGQTLFWDATTNPPSWKIDNNLINDGSHVNIGPLANTSSGNKLRVTSASISDSSVIYAGQINAQAKNAAMRGVAIGNSSQNNSNPLSTAIFGGKYISVNKGDGLAVGVYGQSLADSLSIALVGIATTTTNEGKTIGLYASAPLATGNNYAAVFDKGKVLIKDSLFFDNTANPGSADDVLTRSSTGKARWKPSGAATSVWSHTSNSVTALNNPSDRVGIGTNFPGTNSKLAIKDGHIEIQQTTSPTIIGISSASTSASAMPGTIATDGAGIIQIAITTPTTGKQASVTFDKPYNGIMPVVLLTPIFAEAGYAMSSCQVYVWPTNNGFDIYFGTPFPTPFKTLTFSYMVIGIN